MNWRILLGLVFLLLGMKALYDIMAEKAVAKLSISPIYAELGCTVWIGVGIFLIIKGIGKKEN